MRSGPFSFCVGRFNALRFALRIISGNKFYISRLQRSAERGNRIFTGRAVTTNGLLSNNVCKGYCKKGAVKIGLHLYSRE